ncbi:MAG: hypothetical protein E6R08_10070 [Nevskiaceae bacterium]|nr:MAG: hypothetical protein E6R08_10070 [Nevskiaceae bacterium]
MELMAENDRTASASRNFVRLMLRLVGLLAALVLIALVMSDRVSWLLQLLGISLGGWLLLVGLVELLADRHRARTRQYAAKLTLFKLKRPD